MTSIRLADPFELPEWLGTDRVRWHTAEPLSDGAQVTGVVQADGAKEQELDLLAVDEAYPVPVFPESERRAAHQAWQYGEVLLFYIDDRLTAVAPSTRFDANLACEVLRRVARSVGADSSRFTVSITL